MDILIFNNNNKIKYSKNKVCDHCNNECKTIYSVSEETKNVNICKFCSYVLIYKPINSFKNIILLKSDKNQIDIIKETINYYNINKKIPLPNEIDPNIERINYSSIDLCKLINKYPTIKEHIKNIKIFIIDKNIFPKNILLKEIKNDNLDISIWDTIYKYKIYKLSQDIIDIFDNYLENENKEINQVINNYECQYNNLLDKVNNDISIKLQINNL